MFRGEIAVVCDVCEAEQYLTGENLVQAGVIFEELLYRAGWNFLPTGVLSCPQCEEERHADVSSAR